MLSKKGIIFSMLFAIILAGIYGYYLYNKPVSGLENIAPDIMVEANVLLSEYSINEEDANLKYLDKVIAVSGIVSAIDIEEQVTIHLATENPISEILCQLKNSNSQNSSKPGDLITIKGRCTGYLMDVLLVNSMIIE